MFLRQDIIGWKETMFFENNLRKYIHYMCLLKMECSDKISKFINIHIIWNRPALKSFSSILLSQSCHAIHPWKAYFPLKISHYDLLYMSIRFIGLINNTYLYMKGLSLFEICFTQNNLIFLRNSDIVFLQKVCSHWNEYFYSNIKQRFDFFPP